MNHGFGQYDCTKLIFPNDRYSLGKAALIYRGGRPVGFVVLQLAGRRGEAGESYLKILVLSGEEGKSGFQTVIRWCEKNAIGRLTIPVYTADWWACQELLDHGYTISNSAIRMFYRSDGIDYRRERPLLLCEWAG
ncbi:MAG: hypothetical protein M1379_01055 [Firmicutes bacterium]|nr:hypothetical protein [Bacillota bacterium]